MFLKHMISPEVHHNAFGSCGASSYISLSNNISPIIVKPKILLSYIFVQQVGLQLERN
jgi:hypothetical protein